MVKKLNLNLIRNKFKDKGILTFSPFSLQKYFDVSLVDLLIGAINYDLKIQTGIVTRGDKHKKELVKFLKENLGIENFTNGFRNRKFNIFVDKDIKERPCLSVKAEKEKEPSS